MVVVAGHQPTVERGVPRHAHCGGGLPYGRAVEASGWVVATHGNAVAPHAFTQQVAERGIGLGVALYAAIVLGQDNIQLTAAAWAQVVDGIGPRAHVSGVDRIPVLPHLELGPGLRHATDDRGILLQRVGQHARVRGNLDAKQRNTAKDIAVEKRFADREIAAQPCDTSLCVGLGPAPACCTRTVFAPCLAAAQPPGAKVDTAVDVQVSARITPRIAVVALVGGGLVIDEGCVDAVVPLRSLHLAGQITAHGDLWHRQRQA